jgi:hypothetical protein
MLSISTGLKIAASIPFMVGFVGIICAVLSIVVYDDKVCDEKCNIMWFGGLQPFSLQQIWKELTDPVAADMLALHMPLFALGPHLCGTAGLFFIADAIEEKRRYAWILLSCVVVIAGINDTYGAYYYYLQTDDVGFVIPFTATSMGTLGLYLFRNCLFDDNQYTRVSRVIFPTWYQISRWFAVAVTAVAAGLWLYVYFSFFLPAYLLQPSEPSSLLGLPLPPFTQQLTFKAATGSSGADTSSIAAHLRGFSVMTAQMGWAAGAVGCGLAPLVASMWGLVDSSERLRSRCTFFLGYVSICMVYTSVLMTLRESSLPRSEGALAVHRLVYPMLQTYGTMLGVAVFGLVMSLLQNEYITKDKTS